MIYKRMKRELVAHMCVQCTELKYESNATVWECSGSVPLSLTST